MTPTRMLRFFLALPAAAMLFLPVSIFAQGWSYPNAPRTTRPVVTRQTDSGFDRTVPSKVRGVGYFRDGLGFQTASKHRLEQTQAPTHPLPSTTQSGCTNCQGCADCQGNASCQGCSGNHSGISNYQVARYQQGPNPCFGYGNSCGAGCRVRVKSCRLPGLNGYPYESRPVDGCKCGHHCQKRLYPNINWHWPSPFANMQDYTASDCCVPSRLRDKLDVFADVKLSNYKRKDNGYSGCNCDHFGRLGESHTKAAPVTTSPASTSTARGPANRDANQNRFAPYPSAPVKRAQSIPDVQPGSGVKRYFER